MDLLAYFGASIDLYCERLDPGFWAEPVNALTNLSFIAAALWVSRALQVRQLDQRDLRWLAWSIGLIGICSFAFHTLGQRWAAWLDSGSILLFLLGFAATWTQRVLSWPWSRAWLGAAIAGAFIGLGTMLFLQVHTTWMRPEVAWYLSTWLAIAITAACTPGLAPNGGAMRPWMWGGCGMFTLALALRQLDQSVCPWWPLGTHFGWHLSNGLVTALAMQALMVATPPSGKPVQRALSWPLNWFYTLFVWGMALVLLFEEWGWEYLAAILAWFGRLPGLRWIEGRIQALPPYASLALFGVPLLTLLPVKLLALYWLGHGHTLLGIGVIITAKVGGTAITARLFMLTRPTLMKLAWFAHWFNRWMAFKDGVLARVRASAAWQQWTRAKAAVRQLLQRVRQLFKPR